MKYIAPSFLSADIWRVAEQIELLEQCGCTYLHLDVMDGSFVPNISFGAGIIKSLRPHSKMVFDAHLMVESPEHLLQDFAAAGCDYCTVHAEAVCHLDRTLHFIRDLGMRPGVALNPATPVDSLRHVLPLCDLVLIMSVNPGFGGQKFIPYALDKLREVDALRAQQGLSFLLEVDGGANADNAAALTAAGTDILVAGNAVLGQADIAAAYRRIEAAANNL